MGKEEVMTTEEQLLEFNRAFERALAKMPLDNNILKKSATFSTYSKEQVAQYLKNPLSNQKNLRNVVQYLILNSPQFNILCNYLPNMATFNYALYPDMQKFSGKSINKTKVKKEYVNVAEYLQKLNLKQEFKKILTYNCYFDTFFGCEVETDDSYFIKPLDPQYCRISGEEDGCYVMEFNFSYFTGRETLIYGDELGRVAYPEEFRKCYDIYKNGKFKEAYKWQELQCGICTKYNELYTDYAVPPYISLFGDLSDIEEYKELNKASATTDNYKLISLQIPLNNNNSSNRKDDFKLSTKIIETYMTLLNRQLPEGVGFFPTPMEAKELNFNKSNVDSKNNVQDAIQNLFDDSGFSKLLFSGANNATALSYSVKVDEQKLYAMYRQFERMINRKLKLRFNGKWYINILNMGEFSKNETIDMLLKTAQASVPTKTMLTASLGMTPMEAMSAQFLENEILELHTNWIPPQSSYTQSSSDSEAGRPALSDTEITEAGQQTREIDGNANNKGAV